MRTKLLWEILVPRYSTDSEEYPIAYHQKWDEHVRRIAGGVTILRTAIGHWVNPEGAIFVEEMIPVRVYCDEESIDRIIDHTIEYYDQEAVMAYEISSRVKVKRRDP